MTLWIRSGQPNELAIENPASGRGLVAGVPQSAGAAPLRSAIWRRDQASQFCRYADRSGPTFVKLVQRQTRCAFHHFRVQTKALPGADEAAFFEQFKGLADAFYTSALRETSLAKVYLDMMRSGYRAGYSFHACLRLHAKALTYRSNWPPPHLFGQFFSFSKVYRV